MAHMDFEGWSVGTVKRSGLGFGVYGPRFLPGLEVRAVYSG